MSVQTNININVNVVNHVLAKAGQPPLKPSATDKDVEAAFQQALTDKWKDDFPNVTLPGPNNSFGYFGPFDHLQQGQVPPSVLNQITQDFDNWQIPTDSGVAAQIAKTITTNLYSTGGQAVVLAGTTPSGPNVDIDWLVIAGLGNTEDIVYVFGAATHVDIG